MRDSTPRLVPKSQLVAMARAINAKFDAFIARREAAPGSAVPPPLPCPAQEALFALTERAEQILRDRHAAVNLKKTPGVR